MHGKPASHETAMGSAIESCYGFFYFFSGLKYDCSSSMSME